MQKFEDWCEQHVAATMCMFFGVFLFVCAWMAVGVAIFEDLFRWDAAIWILSGPLAMIVGPYIVYRATRENDDE